MAKKEQNRGIVGEVVRSCKLDIAKFNLPHEVETAILILLNNIKK